MTSCSYLELEPDNIQRIVILRALQLGDMLCAVPAVRAIRIVFPSAVIALIGLPWARDFAGRFSKYIDEYIEFPGYPGLPEREWDEDAVSSFLITVQSRAFDLAVQLHGSGSVVNPLVAQFKARHTAVFVSESAEVPDAKLAVRYREDLSETDRLLEMPKRLAAAFYRTTPEFDHALEFPLRDDERAATERILEQRGVSGSIICVHPGARDPKRRAHPKAFVEAYRALPPELREASTVVITGSSYEMESVHAVVDRLRASGVEEIVETASLDVPLGVLAAQIARAAHLITNDTGASHLADALRTPSTIFFSNSDPLRWAPLDRTLHRIIDLRLPEHALHSEPLLA